MKHTPTPLSVRNLMLHDGEYVYDIEGLEPTDKDDTATILKVARVFQKEHAAEIVQAVNSHDELVAALESARDHLEYCNYGDNWERECAQSQGLADKIESALKNVKGKP